MQFILFFLLLLCFTLSSAVRPHKQNYTLVIKTCENAVFMDLCVSSLKAANGSQHADLQGLTVIALRVAVLNATDTSNHIKGLLNSTATTPTSPSILQLLTDCAENYVDAIDQLQDSIVAMDTKGFSDVNTWVTAAMAEAETCEESFKGDSNNATPLTDRNTIFSQLCSNALAITNILAGM